MPNLAFSQPNSNHSSPAGECVVLHEPARVAEPGGHHRQVHEADLQAGEAHQERPGMSEGQCSGNRM